jgi:ribonuclease BN (tRNA processing enzyme)
MRLTVVGCSPAWPNPGGAHSGYLIEGAGRLLLDCGPGVLGKLREREGGWPQLDAIIVTHWHLDHWGDLVPWVWGRMFGLGHGNSPPELWVPPRGIEVLSAFGKRFGTPTMFEDTFRLSEYAPGEPFEVASGFRVTPIRVPHYTLETYALRVQSGATTLTYSGDTAPGDALAEAARGADLFLCEATLASGELDGEPRGHLSADEAVAAFRVSGARRLLLTHRPTELPLEPGLELAYEGFELDLDE